MGEVLEGQGQQLFRGVAHDVAQDLVDPKPPPVRGHQRDADGGLLEGEPEPLLGKAQSLLYVVAVGDVAGDGVDLHDGPGPIAHW